MQVNDLTLPMALIAMGALPHMAAALSLEKCNRPTSELGYSQEHSHMDLGNGVVAFIAEADVNGDAVRFVNLTACQSGRSISAMSACEEIEADFCPGKPRPRQKSDPVWNKLQAIAASPEQYTMERARDALAALSLETRDTVSDRETCGCRAAYPRLRGNKTRFKMERLN